MAGLAQYAAAGAVAGLGEGLVERARSLREQAMQDQKWQRRQQEREQERQWKIEDREDRQGEARATRASRGGSGGKGLGAATGKPGKAELPPLVDIDGVTYATENAVVKNAETDDDGIRWGDVGGRRVRLMTDDVYKTIDPLTLSATGGASYSTGTGPMTESSSPSETFGAPKSSSVSGAEEEELPPWKRNWQG